jgi:cell division protein FtsB
MTLEENKITGTSYFSVEDSVVVYDDVRLHELEEDDDEASPMVYSVLGFMIGSLAYTYNHYVGAAILVLSLCFLPVIHNFISKKITFFKNKTTTMVTFLLLISTAFVGMVGNKPIEKGEVAGVNENIGEVQKLKDEIEQEKANRERLEKENETLKQENTILTEKLPF